LGFCKLAQFVDALQHFGSVLGDNHPFWQAAGQRGVANLQTIGVIVIQPSSKICPYVRLKKRKMLKI